MFQQPAHWTHHNGGTATASGIINLHSAPRSRWEGAERISFWAVITEACLAHVPRHREELWLLRSWFEYCFRLPVIMRRTHTRITVDIIAFKMPTPKRSQKKQENKETSLNCTDCTRRSRERCVQCRGFTPSSSRRPPAPPKVCRLT